MDCEEAPETPSLQLILVMLIRGVGLKDLAESDYHKSYIFRNITESELG